LSIYEHSQGKYTLAGKLSLSCRVVLSLMNRGYVHD